MITPEQRKKNTAACRKYRENNREHMREYMTEYMKKYRKEVQGMRPNPVTETERHVREIEVYERHLKKSKERYWKNVEESRRKNREYYHANRDKILAKMKKHRDENPEKRKQYEETFQQNFFEKHGMTYAQYRYQQKKMKG